MMKRFIEQAWLSFKGQNAQFSFEEFISLEMVNPLLTLSFYCVLAGYSFNTVNLTSWVVGNSFLLCVSTCIFSLGGSFTAERYFGRIRSIIVSPVNKLSVVIEKGFFPCFVAIATVLVGFVLGSLIFGVDFTKVNMGLFMVVTVIAMFAATGFGLLLAVFGLITDGMHFVLNLTSYVLMIFCGANFPVSQLPDSVEFISRLLPLTRSIEAANMLFGKVEGERFIRLLIGEMGIGVAYFIMGLLIIKVVEKVAIKKATFEVF